MASSRSQQLEHKQVPQWGTEPGVRKGKRSLLACHTHCKCSIKVEIVLSYSETKLQCWVLAPAAKCPKVIASFKPGSTEFLHNVSFFWIRGPTLFSSSSNISGCIRRKLKNECTSSILSSAISRSYWPYCSLFTAESQRHTHMDLHCFCLLLRLRTTRNAACASIMACCPSCNKTCCNSLLLSILQLDWK